MMRWIALATAVLLAPSPAAATEIGIDGGAVLWDGVIDEGRFDAVESTGASWVRLNFRLDRWEAPDEEWLATHDRIVDAYLARGVQVIGLLNDELIDGSIDRNSEAFVAAYVPRAVAVIDHFKDRVRVFEVINEPNDWAGGTTPRFAPYWFARVLQETYLEVKHHAGHLEDPCWQVTLLSGPLFSFDGTTAADYLDEVYAIGRGQLAWDWVREQTGRFPLDGVGYHLYVAQGAEDSLDDVRARTLGNIAAIRDVITAHGDDVELWVSEFGWRADAVGEDGQAARLRAGFEAMRDSGHVAVALYFQLADFPDNQWGVYASGGFDASHRRPAADTLLALAAEHPPAPGARVIACDPVSGDADPPLDAPLDARVPSAGCSAAGAGGFLAIALALAAIVTARGAGRRRRSCRR